MTYLNKIKTLETFSIMSQLLTTKYLLNNQVKLRIKKRTKIQMSGIHLLQRLHQQQKRRLVTGVLLLEASSSSLLWDPELEHKPIEEEATLLMEDLME